MRTVSVSHFKTKQSPRLCSAALQRLVLDLLPSGVDLLTDALLHVGEGEEGEVDGGVCCCVHSCIYLKLPRLSSNNLRIAG